MTTAFALLHALMTLILVGVSSYFSLIIYFRFGFKLKQQPLWSILLCFSGFACIASSILYNKTVWQLLNTNLQLVSLATIFSGIAAVLVIIQMSNSPLLFTTIDPRLSSEPITLILPINNPIQIEFNIYNCSKVTANEVVIMASFPQQTIIKNIDTPTWNNIRDNGHGIEVHLDSDRSYNPVHAFSHSSFTVTLQSEELPEPNAIIVNTMARNMEVQRHTFFIATHSGDFGNMKKRAKNSNLPLVTVREKYLIIQRWCCCALMVLTVTPWLPRLAQIVRNI